METEAVEAFVGIPTSQITQSDVTLPTSHRIPALRVSVVPLWCNTVWGNFRHAQILCRLYTV